MGPPPYRRPNSNLDFAIHFLSEINALSERMPAIHLEPSLTNDIVDILPELEKKRDREKAALQVNQGKEAVAAQKDSLLPPIRAASTSTQTFNSRYQFHPPVSTDTDVVTPTLTPPQPR